MTDLSTLMGTDPEPGTTQPVNAVPGLPDANVTPAGVHPLDQSVPMTDSGQLLEPDKPPSTDDDLGPQGRGRSKPWGTDNETAFPVNQRSAHDWMGRNVTVNAASGPVRLAPRLRGCVATIVWVPSTSATGVQIAADQGDINQGAGVILNPGDSIELDTEGSVWCGVIGANATGGPVQYVRLFNPPGGGLGLSAT